ncbi:MAG: tetratricopeptide (TPR) repeat protein [Candidatus Latescibacterota bacterium]
MVRIRPENPTKLLVLAEELFVANEAFMQAIELARDSSPQDRAEFYNDLATSLLRLGRMAESEDAFIAASKLAEDNWQSCYNIAVIRIKRLDYQGAIPALSKAIDRGMGVKIAIGLGRILVQLEGTGIEELYLRMLGQPDLLEEDRQILNKELQALTQ